MAGLVPAIHAFPTQARTWMPGSRLRQGFAGLRCESAIPPP